MKTTASTAATPIPAGLANLKEGERRIVTAGQTSIGIFKVGGRYHALRNHCPHEGAHLCRGELTGTNLPTDRVGEYNWGRDGMVLRCPWHQWEFDLETGIHLANPSCRVKVYRVVEKDGCLFLE